MNWVDIVAIVGVVVPAAWGWKVGLVKAVLILVGLIVLVPVAAQMSEPIAGALTSTVKSDAIATVAAYLIIGLIFFVGVQVLSNIGAKLLKKAFLGWLNVSGGLMAGVLVGVVLVGATMMALTRFAMLVPDRFEDFSPIDVREKLTNSLIESQAATFYVDLFDVIPAEALGYLPGDFDTAIKELDRLKANET